MISVHKCVGHEIHRNLLNELIVKWMHFCNHILWWCGFFHSYQSSSSCSRNVFLSTQRETSQTDVYLLTLFSIAWLKNNHFEIQYTMHVNDLCRIYNISVNTTNLTLRNQNIGLQFQNYMLLNCTPWSTNRQKKRKRLPKVWPIQYMQQRDRGVRICFSSFLLPKVR